MILSTSEKEKRVLEWLDQNKSYREIQDRLHISSRDISFIAKIEINQQLIIHQNQLI